MRRIHRRKRRRRRLSAAIVLLAAGMLVIMAVLVGIGNLKDSKEVKNADGVVKAALSFRNQDDTEYQKKKTIMLDSGHGGNDPGCTGGEIYEKDVNLEITLKLRNVLEEKGYEVLMTREKDLYVSLEERVSMANQKQPDIFISIHQNALEGDSVSSGIEKYLKGKKTVASDAGEDQTAGKWE